MLALEAFNKIEEVDEADEDEPEWLEDEIVELVLEADDEDEEVRKSKHWLMHEANAACGSVSCCCCWRCSLLVR